MEKLFITPNQLLEDSFKLGKMIFESFVKSQELPVLCISAGLCETTVALTQKSEYASDEPNEVEARFDDNPSITINPPGPPEVDFKKVPTWQHTCQHTWQHTWLARFHSCEVIEV